MSIITKFKANKLLKSGVNYSVFSTVSTLCTMVIGFLNMRWLGPELLGLWQSLAVINLYLPFLQLGIQSGLNLELPLALGAEDHQRAKQLVSTGLAFATLLALVLLASAAVVFFFMYYKGVSMDVLIGTLAIFVIAIISCFRLHFIATYRSANAFDRLTNVYKIEIIVKVLLVYAIYKYQYYGLLLFNVGGELVFTLGLYIKAPYRHLKPRFLKEDFMCLLKRGVL